MVKKVLAWRQENKSEADRIWNNLQRGNEAFAAELTRLAVANTGSGEGSGKYNQLRDVLQKNRALIRQMGESSGVPIEPPQQTHLLDYCSDLDGVIGGVVPGAGGYDAIVLLVEDKEDVVTSLKTALGQYKAKESEEGLRIGRVGIIGVREEMVGVKKEELSLYEAWPTTS